MLKEFSVIKYSKVWLSLSTLLVVAAIIFISGFGLQLGIDFTGGSLIELETRENVDAPVLTQSLADAGFDVVIQSSDGNELIIRSSTLSNEEYIAVVAAVDTSVGVEEELRFESIGPTIGRELQNKSITAVILLSVLIVLYVAYTFRKVSEPVASWKYGLLTIVAALHDMIIPLGIFAILGKFTGYHVDTTVIAALLTILGYSINDTIVVFDRTRENLLSAPHSTKSFGETVDLSVRQSFARSINTSLTTLLVLGSIYLFGGETTRPFILTLIIGVVAGAYSSIFLASPLLVLWQGKEKE